MKKLFALALVVFGLAACQTEPEGLDVQMGGEQEVMLTVSLPEATRANSAEGAFGNVNWGTYSLRYILEVYRVNDDAVLYDTCQRFVETSDNTSMVFPVRLAQGYNYRIVAWADIVVGDSEEDRYYYTEEGLDNVVIKDNGSVNWNPMDETRDAYTCVNVVNNFSSTSELDMILTRPFAKLRVVATDIDDIRKVGLKPTTATVEYSQNMYVKYNAVEDKCIADGAKMKKHEYTYADTASKYEDDEDVEYTLFTDYIFVPSTGTAKFTLTVNAAAGVIKETAFNTEISVERNKLTTIKGDVLTTGGNVTIKVENELGQLETINYADNAETLQEIINEAPAGEQTNITLGGDINLGDLLNAGILSTTRAESQYGLVIPAGKVIVLDLNGHTISQTKAQAGAYAMIDNKGTLTIEDSSANKSGKIAYGDTGNGGNYVSNTISNSGVLTINGGTIENNSSDTVAANGYPHPIDNSGTLTINGGIFTNNANYSSMRIWCTTDDDTIVTIKGGTFNGSIDFQTPNASANKGTLTIIGGTFNADTYTNCAVRLLGFGADVDEMNGYITGGNFNGAIALKNWSGSEFNSKVFNITGGTFTVDPSEFVDDDYSVVMNNNVYTLELKTPIAKIGDVEYRTLNRAVAAAQNGDTIVFTNDVEQADGVVITDKNITIDLNEKTFTVSNGANTNNRNFKVNGSSVVTIKNGTMVAAGEYSSGAYGTLRTEGTAKVTLNGVTLYNYRGNGLNVKALSGTTVTITDTEIYSQYGGGVEAAGGTVELTNVKVEQKGMYTAPYNSMAISVNGGGQATINSGTYSTECLTAEEANNQGTSHGPWCAGVLNSGGTLIIKGGTFSNDNYGDNALATAARGLLLADTGAKIQIEGGTFNAVKSIIDIQNNLGDASKNPTATISGGDFSADPLTWDGLISVAEGYVVDEENGRYTVVKDVKVAKVGNTEYRKIDEAIAAWTNNTTLTLLSDVTLTDVIKISSTEMHTLDLGTYTLTSAKSKNAIEIVNNGRSSASYALDIKADATNPGGITASSAVVKTTGKSGVKDRPIIRFYNGVFNASNIINHGGSNGTNSPQFIFYNGVYNGNISTNRAICTFEGGTFNGRFFMSVDSSSYARIGGGKFKYMDNLYGSALNSDKFTIGSAKGVFDRGVYVDDEGYIVVGGPVITEFGDKFEAKVTNVSVVGSYLPYSSAAEHGLYYTNAEMATANKNANVELK